MRNVHKVEATRRGVAKKGCSSPGLMIDTIADKYERDSNRAKKQEDAVNREYVVNKLLEYMSSGKTEEEALDLIMKDEIASKFDYLTKNGLDKRKCFKNWAIGAIRAKDSSRDFVRR